MAYDQRPPLLERVVAAIVDIALALLLALVMVVAAAEPGPAGADEPLAVSLVAAFAMTLPLALRRRRPVGVVVVVVRARFVSVFSAVRAGARGCLLRGTPRGDLLGAVRVAAGGEARLAPTTTRRLIAEVAKRPEQRWRRARRREGITAREREV